MGLINEVSGVFDFLRGFYECLPVAVRLLIMASFGGFIFLGVLNSFRR